ncbi:ABC transporter F family member 4-like [Phlebotomus argentipes]|uniref:ABC transporter F family member 4-like n=1 Tax=Phlebotomus argentipes TaxID=94469 RepID=UPI002892BA2B|nr:ABC transporter F family member 4-like [Phlebotomus argentipes]
MLLKWVTIVALELLLVSLGATQDRNYERDFEVFQAGGGDRSQSIYSLYDEEDRQRAHGFSGPLEGFGSESKITYLPYYLSPDEVKRNYRSAPKYGGNNREGSLQSYDEFFERNFGQNYQAYDSKAPLRSTEEREETEHETEAPRAGPRKFKKGGRKASYKAQPREETEDIPYDYSYGGSSSYNPSDEYQRIKYLSEQQAKEIQQNPSHCKVVQKEEMECHICHDPKSGAKSESCSYASRPAAKKYAFVKEKKYNSKDDEDSDEDEAEEAPQPKKSESLRSARPQRRPSKTTPAEVTHAALTAAPRRRPVSRGKKASENRPQRDVVGLDPYLYGGSDDDDDDNDEEEDEEEEQQKPKKKQKTAKQSQFGKIKSYEDYFSHVFPEQHGRKSKEALKSESEYEFIPDYEHKKNVEEVLAEFKTKDWSKCKKSQKGDLTCYECKDPNGVLHEECMFVSESSPRSSRLTYEENKKYAQPNPEEQQTEEPQSDEDDYEDAGDSASQVVTERSARLRQRDSAPKPEESLDQKLPKKRTIKRKVTYRHKGTPDRLDNDESRVVYYEQKFTHTEN